MSTCEQREMSTCEQREMCTCELHEMCTCELREMSTDAPGNRSLRLLGDLNFRRKNPQIDVSCDHLSQMAKCYDNVIMAFDHHSLTH